MIQLYSKNDIEENPSLLEEWEHSAFEHFSAKMKDKTKPFPCIPAHQGFMFNHFKYAFLKDPREPDAHKDLAEALKIYSSCSKEMGDYTSLIVFFNTPNDLLESNVKEYESLFWSLLNGASEMDEKEWPAHIPTDPAHHEWEYCFHGDQYFIYCATPAHMKRNSRSFPFFMLAITPRHVLERFNHSTHTAPKIKQLIRERLAAYDEIPAHPELKWYGQADNHEWKQYFLSDDNTSLSSCPFARFRKNNPITDHE